MAAGQRSHQRIRVSMLLLLGRRFDPAVSIQIPGLSGRLPDRRHGWRGIVRRSEGHAEGPFDSRADRRAENHAEPERTHRARAVIERGPEYSHPFLQKCAHRPIHFVITKWDILQDKYSFKQVKDELLNNENFRKFISQRVDLHSPVHLIPTSSLGKDFAVFDLKDLRMKKVKGGKIKPYNVELSIGMTITDQLLLLSNHPGYRDFRPQ